MGDSERMQRPKRPSRNVEKSKEFSNDFEEEFVDDWVDNDNSFEIGEGIGFDSDFGGFESTPDMGTEEFPDEDYQDFSTDKEVEEERPKRPQRPQRGERPQRAERPARASRPKREVEEEEPEEEEVEQVQVRHRRVRENEAVEEKPQMFSFSSDINRMTVTTMLQDVDMQDYAFNEEGNLIRKDEAAEGDASKEVNSMQAVESLEDLLGGLEDSTALGTDEDLSKEIAADIEAAPAEETPTEEPEEEPTETPEETPEEAPEEMDEIAAELKEVELAEEKVKEALTEATKEEVATSMDGTLVERLQSASFNYREQVLNRGIESLSDIEIRYFYDGDYKVIPANRNSLAMPNCKVYKNNRTEKWTKAQEVRLNVGDRVDIDFGVGVVLPKGYGLAARYNKDLLDKFGLDPVEPKRVFNTLEAATALSLSFIARSATAYVARFQPLVELEVVKMNERF